MPIIGKVIVEKPSNWLQYLPEKSTGYISTHVVVVTEKAVFFNLEALVLSLEEKLESEEALFFLIKVTRIGSGTTPEDFEFDFSECPNKPPLFNLNSENVYAELEEDSDFLMVPLSEGQLKIVSTTYEEDELTSLKLQLDRAKESEDFELATKLRDQIAVLEKKRKKYKKPLP